MKVFSQLVSAQFENKTADYAAGTGKFWIRTDTSPVVTKFYDGSAVRTFVTADNTQTLTNKTLTSPTLTTPTIDIPLLSHQTTPANPAAGNVKTYFKSDNLLYSLSSGGTETTYATTSTVSPDQSYELSNLTVACSVGSSALTVALKGKDGNDPSGSNVVGIGFRHATSATGRYLRRTVTGALSTVVSSGSTLGHASTVQAYIYVYAIDNAGTVELAYSTAVWDEGSVQNTTAEGGAGAADSNAVLYSTTARTSVPIRLIARLSSTQTTAGTWAAVPSEISLTPFMDQSVIAVYESNTGSLITNTTIPTGEAIMEDKVIDTHNAYNTGTGVFTVPVAGKYRITATMTSASTANWTNTTIWQLRLYVATVHTRAMGTWQADSTATTPAYASGSAIINCAAGVALEVRIFQNKGGGGQLALNGSATDNWVCYERIGP